MGSEEALAKGAEEKERATRGVLPTTEDMAVSVRDSGAEGAALITEAIKG
jgi:hypothetical protein